jgi:hypothetical protein
MIPECTLMHSGVRSGANKVGPRAAPLPTWRSSAAARRAIFKSPGAPEPALNPDLTSASPRQVDSCAVAAPPHHSYRTRAKSLIRRNAALTAIFAFDLFEHQKIAGEPAPTRAKTATAN